MDSGGSDNLFEGLFSEQVVIDAGGLSDAQGEIYPEEQACIDGAVFRRRQEFAAGRIRARRALARLGILGFPLLVGRGRAPMWPAEVVGSITHCREYCGVAVARRTDADGLGLDVERIDRVHEALWRHICTPEELAWVDSLACGQRQPGVALVFSAKETFHKCRYPITEQWLDFTDVVVRVDIHRQEYEVGLVVPRQEALASSFRGRFLIRDNLVFTGMTLERATPL